MDTQSVARAIFLFLHTHFIVITSLPYISLNFCNKNIALVEITQIKNNTNNKQTNKINDDHQRHLDDCCVTLTPQLLTHLCTNREKSPSCIVDIEPDNTSIIHRVKKQLSFFLCYCCSCSIDICIDSLPF